VELNAEQAHILSRVRSESNVGGPRGVRLESGEKFLPNHEEEVFKLALRRGRGYALKLIKYL
jgi:hypothetical protein